MSKITSQILNTIIDDIKAESKTLDGKTILISGGSGFIGSYINVVLYLLNKKVFVNKCKVISIDNYITVSKKNFLLNIKDNNFQFLDGDIRLPVITNEKVDYIIHAAGLASPFYYKNIPWKQLKVPYSEQKTSWNLPE